jgi:hypothetical protein
MPTRVPVSSDAPPSVRPPPKPPHGYEDADPDIDYDNDDASLYSEYTVVDWQSVPPLDRYDYEDDDFSIFTNVDWQSVPPLDYEDDDFSVYTNVDWQSVPPLFDDFSVCPDSTYLEEILHALRYPTATSLHWTQIISLIYPSIQASSTPTANVPWMLRKVCTFWTRKDSGTAPPGDSAPPNNVE